MLHRYVCYTGVAHISTLIYKLFNISFFIIIFLRRKMSSDYSKKMPVSVKTSLIDELTTYLFIYLFQQFFLLD